MNTDTNKNMYYVIAFVVIGALVWAAFMWMTGPVETPQSPTTTSTVGTNTTTQETASSTQSVTYFVPEKDETLSCNGENMDSVG